MNKVLIFIVCCFFASCESDKTGIVINKESVSITDQGLRINNIIPYINQRKLKFTNSEITDNKVTVRYSDDDNRLIDLIISANQSDSLKLYQFSAHILGNVSWQATDTLKLLFESVNSIQAGIYSKLYEPVFSWCKPVQFFNLNQIDTTQGIQFAYWKIENNSYVFTMPLGGGGFTFSLGKNKNGFGAIGYTQFPTEIHKEIPILSIGVSKDIYKLIPGAIEKSFDIMGISKNIRKEKKKPEMWKYLGWASWNAFMHDVSNEKILRTAKSFKNAGVPVKWFLIDDGWLDVGDNKLNSYKPDKRKFPHEFKALTSTLKSKFHIQDVGVWHTLNGYWEGIKPDGELAKQLPELISYQDQIPWLSTIEKEMHFVNPFKKEGYQFYDDWYSYLQDQGMTFVKVDNQLAVNKISRGNFPAWQTGEKMMSNLHQAAKKYFNGNVINCMNMTNNDFYHYCNSAVARTSEDYNPSSNPNLFGCTFQGNAAAHILACIHNSVWMSNIVWPDYDMFQSTDKDAWYFAMAKVMSAGPIYITDAPNQHNVELLHSITLKSGKVISADLPALPTEDCFFQLFESEKPFKAFSNYHGSGLLAAWNVSDRNSVAGSFKPSEIIDLNPGKYVVFDFIAKSVLEADSSTNIQVKLNRMKSNIFSVIPLESGKAIIGDATKVIPLAVISNSSIDKNSIKANISEKCTIWIYTKSRPKEVFVNSQRNNEYEMDNNLIIIKLEEAYSTLRVEF